MTPKQFREGLSKFEMTLTWNRLFQVYEVSLDGQQLFELTKQEITDCREIPVLLARKMLSEQEGGI